MGFKESENLTVVIIQLLPFSLIICGKLLTHVCLLVPVKLRGWKGDRRSGDALAMCHKTL